MGYIINNGIPYGGTEFVENDVDITFISGEREATSEEELCKSLCLEFLQQTKSHGFVSITWTGNDYFTGVISKYASGTAQLIMGRANQSYILKAKSNGTTITVAKIQ